MRHVARKVGLYDLEVVLPWGCYFWTDGLAYNRWSNKMNLLGG